MPGFTLDPNFAEKHENLLAWSAPTPFRLCLHRRKKKTAKLKELDANETIHGDENFNLFI